jgi:hypothetical protein
MADVSEIQQAKKWIYDSLVASSDITGVVSTRIFAGVANSFVSPGWPFILYTFLASTDVDGLGTNRIFSKPLFQIIVVSDKSPDANVRKVDKRIDDILGVAVTQLSGDYYFTARREQSVDRVFTDPTGKNYYSLGGLFRLYIGRTT